MNKHILKKYSIKFKLLAVGQTEICTIQNNIMLNIVLNIDGDVVENILYNFLFDNDLNDEHVF